MQQKSRLVRAGRLFCFGGQRKPESPPPQKNAFCVFERESRGIGVLDKSTSLRKLVFDAFERGAI